MINHLFPSCILRRGSCCFPLAWNLTSPGIQMRTVLPILVNEWSLVITVLVRIFYSLAFANWRVFFFIVCACLWLSRGSTFSSWDLILVRLEQFSETVPGIGQTPRTERSWGGKLIWRLFHTESQQTALVRKREAFRREGACCFGWCQGMIPSTFLCIQLFTGEGWEVSLLV